MTTEPSNDAPDVAAATLRRMGSQLHRAGRPAFVVLTALGLTHAASGAEKAAAAFAAVATGVVLGWLADLFLRAAGVYLEGLAAQLDGVGRIEQHLTASFQTIAASLDALREAGPPARAASDVVAERVAEIRHALRNGLWAEAESNLAALVETRPDSPETHRVQAEAAEARQAASTDLLGKIAAAREVNDPDRVLELHGLVRPLLDAEALRPLDRDLAKWFMGLIQRRLRTGTVRADVVALADRVAESLGDTIEGASLRASLPTLRRAAGLCPRCGQPYTGIGDACPKCLASVLASKAPFEVAEVDDLPPSEPAESPFIDEEEGPEPGAAP